MTEAIFKQNSGQQDYTPGAAVKGGDVVELADGRAGVVKASLAASEKGAVYTKGIFEITSATATLFSAGDPVWWDASANLAITTQDDSADFFLGSAEIAKVSGDLEVRVDLNEGGEGSGRGIWQTRVVELVHDDATVQVLIDAADNPDGLLVHEFIGVVSEAPAGSSEDQLIMQLLDEDDNVQSIMTTTNTTPDAAGDLIKGTRGATDGATGVVAAIIPAGKSAKVKVSQATVGTPAGQVKVRALVSSLL